MVVLSTRSLIKFDVKKANKFEARSVKLQELRRFSMIMKSYERTQVLYFCAEVINVRIEVVYNVTSMRYVNKWRIFVKEVLLTQYPYL